MKMMIMMFIIKMIIKIMINILKLKRINMNGLISILSILTISFY